MRDMKRYIALLRGINVSGKNKIAMSELKKGCTELGFAEAATYLTAGMLFFQVRLMIKIIFQIK